MKKRRNENNNRRHGIQVVTLCISTTMVLTLLGLVVLSVLTARNLSTYVRENMAVNVVLGDTVSLADSEALGRQISALPYARQVTYVSKEQALATMTAELGADPVEFADVNPFQAELEILLRADYATNDSLRIIAQQLQQDNRVVDVAYQENQIEDVNRNIQRISLIMLVLAVLLIVVSYALISSSVRLGIYARRFNIHTMKLVGASWGFIRRPFLQRGILIGVVSSILACLVLGGVAYALYRYQPGARDLVTWRDLAITAVAVFVFGFTMMTLCTLLSVNRFLRMTAGALYKI